MVQRNTDCHMPFLAVKQFNRYYDFIIQFLRVIIPIFFNFIFIF